MTEDLTRRGLFGLAGASAASAAGLGLGACTPSPPSVRTIQAADSSSGPPFLSRPDLTPPRITVRRHVVPSDPRYIFLNGPYSGPGHGGSYIVDTHGQLVWLGPNTAAHHRMNFSVQTYNGRPALTWFQGLIVAGFGKGELVIADSSYKILHTIRPVSGELADFHEFVVTPPGTQGSKLGTALITIYRAHSNVDLRAVRGPANGHLLSGVAQEIDIATGSYCSSGTAGHAPIRPYRWPRPTRSSASGTAATGRRPRRTTTSTSIRSPRSATARETY